jgi:hypothetical protein
MKQVIDLLNTLKTSKVENYVVAGLDSYLVGNGTVRYFECSRNHQDQITPHSHRFDFACIVLAGEVTNRVWKKTARMDKGDTFVESTLVYDGVIGEHTVVEGELGSWCYEDALYTSGQCYGMSAEEVHSIQFSRGARVLFLEGIDITNESKIIQPFVGGELIPTYQKLSYMFKGLA